MKLHAVTICIGYHDYLECILRNRVHFDRWIILTVPDDDATHAVCKRHGIEWLDSALLRRDGTDFNAAWNKGIILNEGLALLDPLSWALILDSDVLLPRHFRKRLERIQLNRGYIYGVCGRKVCVTRAQFEMIRECEPWTCGITRNSQPLGYFQLFHLGLAPNRYPVAGPQSRTLHDDDLFTESFSPNARKVLPMTVLHTGSIRTNWDRRKTLTFELDEAQNCVSGLTTELQRILLDPRTSTGSAVVIGYFPGGRWRFLRKSFARIFLVDYHRLHTQAAARTLENDRLALRESVNEEVVADQEIIFVGPLCVSNVATFADASIDLLYLAGEIDADALGLILRTWASKLRDGGIVCGDLFGFAQWPFATCMISCWIGPPDRVSATGFWWKTWKSDRSSFQTDHCSLNPIPPERNDRIVIVSVNTVIVEPLIFSLHSIRDHWKGPINVFHWGQPVESLSVACNCWGISLLNVGVFPSVTETTIEDIYSLLVRVLPECPTLLLKPGMLAVRRLEFAELETMTPVSELSAEPLLLGFDAHSPKPRAVRCHHATDLTIYNGKSAIIQFDGHPNDWTESAWSAWTEREIKVSKESRAIIGVPGNVIIVTIVTAVNYGDFQRNWLTWQFAPHSPVVLILVDLPVTDLWLPGDGRPLKIIELVTSEIADLGHLLQTVAEACCANRVIFLPAVATALPGADLWIAPFWAQYDVVVHDTSAARGEKEITNNRFVPMPFFAIMKLDFLKEVTALPNARTFLIEEMHFFIAWACVELVGRIAWLDQRLYGWKFSATHCYLSRRQHARPPTSSAIPSALGHGKRKFTEDLVVISSLPSSSRRAPVHELMQREGLVYRFCDALGVSYQEILPDEVADVEWFFSETMSDREKRLCKIVARRRTHVSCLHDAYALGRRSIMILEDDVRFDDRWMSAVEAALVDLPTGWLQLYLSTFDYSATEQVSQHVHRLSGVHPAKAVLYSETGIEAGVECLSRARNDIELWMSEHLHPYGCSYAVHPRITSNDP